MPRLSRITLVLGGLLVASTASGPAGADPARDAILKGYAAEAGITAFSAADGKALFQGKHSGGKPDTPSCTTCHTADPRAMGRTRAGKPIEPMAVSANPTRFTDAAKVKKWLRRNCNSVLGRACSAKEKGDVITYLSGL
jgi:mono/diheme cytochrome c family protein